MHIKKYLVRDYYSLIKSFQVAQKKNLPANADGWDRGLILVGEIPGGGQTHLVLLPEESPWDEEPAGYSPGHIESDSDLAHTHMHM